MLEEWDSQYLKKNRDVLFIQAALTVILDFITNNTK
jgi:hypothetical protein